MYQGKGIPIQVYRTPVLVVPLLATITTSYTCSPYVNPSLSFSIDTLIKISQHQTNTIPSNGTGTRCNDNTSIVIGVFAVCVIKGAD